MNLEFLHDLNIRKQKRGMILQNSKTAVNAEQKYRGPSITPLNNTTGYRGGM